MKDFLKTKWGKITLAAVLVTVIALGGLGLWLGLRPVFQDVTIELGQDLPAVEAFLTENANAEKASLKTTEDQIDLNHVGEYVIELTYGSRNETAVLTIVDTTAPVVTFCDVSASVADTLKPEDFVTEITDYSETTVSFAQAVTVPESYDGVTVEILVTDASGNETTGTCNVFYSWMVPTVTLELGDTLDKEDLLLDPGKDVDLLDQEALDQISSAGVGSYTVTSTDGAQSCECVVTVADTTAPTASFVDVSAAIDDTLKAEDFVTDVFDLAETTVEFVTAPEVPESYGKVTVEVVVTDASGNSITGQCSLYYTWMIHAYTAEFGVPVEKADLLMDAEKDGALLDQAALDAINASGVGTYTITSQDGDQSCECVITIQDTVGPTIKLKDVTVYVGDSVSEDNFLSSVSDLSGVETTTMVTVPDTGKAGTQTITFEATDIYGNKTTATATLEVIEDTEGPTFSGVGDMSVKKDSEPDYEKGVSAVDAKDGKVSFTVDSSRVDLSEAGTYYVVYTATDKSGNKTTFRRKVVVNHDGNDTDAMVKSIAAKLSDDPEEIRDYVRNRIAYNHNWGGDDPVWYGFTTNTGNCYVHALCLQVLLTEKGYETQLIWVKEQYDPHYWLIINLDGTWWHIDATPGPTHTIYSLMNDSMRLETLKGRDWDHSKWPACDGEVDGH